MNDVALVLCADNQFSMPLAISLYSALININPLSLVNVFIIDGGISNKNKNRINKILNKTPVTLNINWIPYDTDKVTNVSVTKDISKATYLRILIPELLPANIEKAIYLDCDIIVEADLKKIWDLPFDGNLAMGVQDYCFPYLSSDQTIARHETNLNDAIYCNAGVLVINISAWRQQNISSKILTCVIDKHYNDQQGINFIIDGKWKLLDPRWNVTLSSVNMLSEQQYRIVTINPYVIHYTSRFKPWHITFDKAALLSFYYHQKERNRFYYYVKESNWFNSPYADFWIACRQFALTGFKVFKKLSTNSSLNNA